MARSIAGLFPDRASADDAIDDLQEQGFDPARIGVIMRETAEPVDIGATAPRRHSRHAAFGAIAGGVVGGTIGALVIPWIAHVIAAGVLAALAGAAGWRVGGHVGRRIRSDEARYDESEAQNGRALITVFPHGREDEARAILLCHGAESMQSQPQTER